MLKILRYLCSYFSLYTSAILKVTQIKIDIYNLKYITKFIFSALKNKLSSLWIY